MHTFCCVYFNVCLLILQEHGEWIKLETSNAEPKVQRQSNAQR